MLVSGPGHRSHREHGHGPGPAVGPGTNLCSSPSPRPDTAHQAPSSAPEGSAVPETPQLPALHLVTVELGTKGLNMNRSTQNSPQRWRGFLGPQPCPEGGGTAAPQTGATGC